MESGIPLWVEGNLLWVTHLSNRSTCSDVIRSVLKFRAEAQKPENYRVVERWKRVERHLSSRCKILKIWHAWGEQRKNVRFLLRKNRRRRRRRRMDSALTNTRSPLLPLHGKRNSKYRMHKSRAAGHPKLPNVRNFEKPWDGDLEKFRKIVSTQKQILTRQRQKLLDKDEEIDHYETIIHLNRVEDLGENYLQDAYLGEDEEHEVSDAEGESQLKSWCSVRSSKKAIHEATELYERILEISKRIEKQEDYIRVLSAQIRHSISLKDHSDTDEAVSNAATEDENLEAYLYKTKIRIECLAALNRSQTLAIEHNDRTLREYNKIYEHKCRYLKQLESDLDQADIDTRRIQQRRLHHKLFSCDKDILMRPNNTRRRTFSNSKGNALLPENNNSDTGLSSLHSSSDECGNILDTLV